VKSQKTAEQDGKRHLNRTGVSIHLIYQQALASAFCTACRESRIKTSNGVVVDEFQEHPFQIFLLQVIPPISIIRTLEKSGDEHADNATKWAGRRDVPWQGTEKFIPAFLLFRYV
jgi:hypothetical protein